MIRKSTIKNKKVGLTEFLNAQKKGTKAVYKVFMKYFLEYTQMTDKEILEHKKQDRSFTWEKRVMDFRNWLLERGFSENYVKTGIASVRGFFAYHREPLKFRRSETKRLNESNRVTEDYLFDREDLSKMAMHGNLIQRYVVLVGKSLGLRSSDFITLTYGKYRGLKLDNEAPIFIGETTTQKEKVKAYPFLDTDSIPVVKEILSSNPSAKNEDRILEIQEDELTEILKILVKKTNIETGSKHVRFHSLRKYLIDRLSAYASESQWKQIIGKKISEGAYISHNQLREIYKRAMPDIVVLQRTNGRINELEEILNLTKEAVGELLRPIVERLYYQRQSKDILGLSEMPPDFRNMETKELLKEYLKLVRGD